MTDEAPTVTRVTPRTPRMRAGKYDKDWQLRPMKYRRLGRNGPVVSAIGLGRSSQSVPGGGMSELDYSDTIRRAIDLGINFFDTADSYWKARHEEMLGRAVQGRRHNVVIATKFGNIDLPDGSKA